jgi:hypothetical protein
VEFLRKQALIEMGACFCVGTGRSNGKKDVCRLLHPSRKRGFRWIGPEVTTT